MQVTANNGQGLVIKGYIDTDPQDIERFGQHANVEDVILDGKTVELEEAGITEDEAEEALWRAFEAACEAKDVAAEEAWERKQEDLKNN